MGLSAERILKFQQALVRILSESGSMQDLLDRAHEEFKRPMFIKGDGSRIYAITANYGPDTHPNWSSFLHNLASRSAEFESVRTVSEDPVFSHAFSQKQAAILKSPSYGGMVLHANVWVNDTRLCEIVVLENKQDFTSDDVELMNIFVQYVQLYISINRDLYLAGTDLSVTFTALFENRPVSPAELLEISSRTGWDSEDELAVLTADSDAKKDTPMLAVFRDKLKNILHDSVTFIYRNHVVSIINISRSGDYQSVCRQVSRLIVSESMHCGMSFEYSGLERTVQFYHMARLVCSVADKLGKKFMDMYKAAPVRITQRIHDITDLQDLIHPDLLLLDRLDPHRTSHYLETLYAFLLCGGNYTDTANYLGLHRNSLIYRMNRIQDIIRSSLNDVNNRHFLMISFLLMGISF